jgi:putative lipoprotein
MRNQTGRLTLPANVPATSAGLVLVEVRDVSEADAPSVVVAELRLRDVPLAPHGQIPFQLRVPDVPSNRVLSVRAHISTDGSGQVKAGDLLTIAHLPVPSTGTPEPLDVPVAVI